jgi:hypothetical protein
MTGESIGSSVVRTQAAVLDRGPSLDDAGDRGGPTLGRLLEGVSGERARCLRGIWVVEIPPRLSNIRTAALKAKSQRNLGNAKRAGRMRVRPVCPPRSSNPKHKLCYRPSVIREIEILRVAVLMVNRYADEAEAIASGVPRS